VYISILQRFQGITEPIWAWIRVGDEVAYKEFFPLAFIIGNSQSQDKICE